MRAIAMERPADCPECRSRGSVVGEVCEICMTDLGEGAPVRRRLPSVSDGLSLEELVARLETLVIEALREGRFALAAEGRRVQALLQALRSQFLRDVAEALPEV